MIKKAIRFLAPALLTVGLMASIAPSTPAEAAGLSDKQVQWNLAGLGYLKYKDIDGKYGPKTKAAVRSFQTNRCLGVDGVAGRQTDDELLALVRAVQRKVGAGQDGKNGPNTKQKIINWQRNHGLVADGMAGPGTFAKMGIGPWKKNCGGGNPGGGSGATAACASGTVDLDVHSTARGRIRLCAIPDFFSSGDASQPGSKYYVKDAKGRVIVSTKVSRQVLQLFRDARRDGVEMRANSSFRPYQQQKDLCQPIPNTKKCRKPGVAYPGNSMHEVGEAIDFSMGSMNAKSNATCSNRQTRWGNPIYKWLRGNAERYGFRQLATEAWHWDTKRSASRCS